MKADDLILFPMATIEICQIENAFLGVDVETRECLAENVEGICVTRHGGVGRIVGLQSENRSELVVTAVLSSVRETHPHNANGAFEHEVWTVRQIESPQVVA